MTAGADEFETSTLTFEQLVDQLEATARAMEASHLGIEAAAELYARAGALHRAANERLATVQARLEELRERDVNETPRVLREY